MRWPVRYARRRKAAWCEHPGSAWCLNVEEDRDRTDVELMMRTAGGDLRAFSELVKRHQNSLMNFFARSGVYADVEDLAQETFLKIYRSRSSYRPLAKFTTFMYLVARRVMIDAARRNARRAKLAEEALQEMPQSVSAPESRGEYGDVEGALTRLSEPMRETLVLVVMQGLAYKEAAEVLGIPVGTVKSRVSAALDRMREMLGED